jgi:hypothetical protein
MIRQTCPNFVTIQADGAPYGATINSLHLTNVRIQPQIDGTTGEPTGKTQVAVCMVDGIQVLTYDTLEEAQAEYYRLSNLLLGLPKEE